MIQRGRGKMIQSEIIYLDSVLKHFQEIFLSKLSIPITSKLKQYCYARKVSFHFQNVNEWSTVSFCPVANHEK